MQLRRRKLIFPHFFAKQIQLQEEESMHAEVDKWQRRYQNINYELEVQKTKMKERLV